MSVVVEGEVGDRGPKRLDGGDELASGGEVRIGRAEDAAQLAIGRETAPEVEEIGRHPRRGGLVETGLNGQARRRKRAQVGALVPGPAAGTGNGG